MIAKKYEFTGESREFFGYVLHRIRATRDFGDVKAGDLGGWIESEINLSIDGDAWVYDNAKIYESARVYGNAKIKDNAEICNKVKVFGDAEIYGDTWLHGDIMIFGDARICEDKDVLWITHIGSRLGTTLAYRNKNKSLTISCGCFLGTLEEFNKQVEQTHGDTRYGKEYKALIELIKIHFEI